MLPLILLIATASAPAPEDAPSAETIQAQAARCRALLKSSIVDLYLPANVDRARGGYFEVIKGGEFVPSGEKFLVMQARQLWFFSTLSIEKIDTDKALDAARIGFQFLQSKMKDTTHGGYFAKVSDDGAPVDRRKHAYLQSFALYGLIAYHRASGDEAALVAAKDLFRILESKAHDATNGGYHEFFREDWTPITDPSEPGFVGAIGTKTYNTHLHLLEAFTALYRAWPAPPVKERLNELIVILTSTVRHPDFACNLDGFSPDWRRVETPANLRASYGHDIECLWLVLDAADAIGLPRATLRSWAVAIGGYGLRFGYDLDHGGFFYTGPLGAPADDTRKEWWVQAEALVGLLALHEATGRRDAYDAFAKTLDFISAHQVAPAGGWYRARKADGSRLDDTLSSAWQCAYHDGRALIESARRLDMMSARLATKSRR